MRSEAPPRDPSRRGGYSTVWERRDGSLEIHCPECGKWLATISSRLGEAEWLQLVCKTCGNRERRFVGPDGLVTKEGVALSGPSRSEWPEWPGANGGAGTWSPTRRS